MERAVELVDASAEGSDYESFFRHQYPLLVRMLYLMTGDRSEAEEMAQETLARAYERWERVKTMASPGGYVCRVALNLNRRRLRRLRLAARVALRGTRPGGEPSPEVKTEVGLALASLPRGQREALLLVEWAGMDSREAGRVLGIAPASVRSRVRRAREAMRERLEVTDA